MLCLLEAPKDGNEGRNARSGYQTCIDFIRTHYIVNEQEIDSKSTINLLNNKSQQITGIDFTDGLPNLDKNSKDYLSVTRQLFIGMFRQAQFQANAKHLIVPQNSLLEELGINCNQLGYKRALEIQLAPIFDSKQMLLSHDKKRVSIKCEKQNSIDFLYSADIRVNEISHNGFNKEGKEKVIKSRLYFTIELGKSGKIIYKDGKVILELPNNLNKELVSEIKEFYKYPLHVAARYGDINTIRRLLDSRVNVNETLKYQLDEDIIQDTKRTSLHEACFCGNIGVAELLIKHGAKVNIVSNIGSPLHCASHGNLSVVNLLLKHGANPWIKNHFGATPLHVALENKNYIIASKLIDEVEEKRICKYT